MIQNKTKGLIAAPFTAMDEMGVVNLAIIESYADHLKGMGVKGAFVAGTTGEGMLLSDEERLTVIENWIDQKTDDFRVIAHAGSTSISSAKTIAYESAKAGADAIAIMGPPFLGPKRWRIWLTFVSTLPLLHLKFHFIIITCRPYRG